MADPWYHGTSGDFEYEVLGYQLENGARIEGVPSQRLMRNDDLTGVLITTHPKGDPEAARHFWVHNPMGGDPSDWIRHISIAASRYGVDLEFDVDDGE